MVDSWVAEFDSWDVCDQVAQWIAKDAIRELESPAIHASLVR